MHSTSYTKIKLLLIDSNFLFREGLKRILEKNEDFQIVAEGDSGEQLLPLYDQHQPDVVIFDPNLSQEDGIEALRNLTLHFPTSKVLIFTVNDEFSYASQTIIEGASGYLLKKMDTASIIEAIRWAANGDFYLHPTIANDFLFNLKKLCEDEQGTKFMQTEINPPHHLLTLRQSETLQLLSEGHNNKSLSEVLGISEKTVKNHVSAILSKLGVIDRTQAVVSALKNGWIELK